jgi:hypothetical protein
MIIELWNDLVRWVRSDDGWAVVTGMILPFVAILAAGIIAGLVARAANKRLLRHQSDESKAASIAGLLAMARRATVWTSLSASEKDHVDYQITEAIVRLRLQPIAGSDMAAEWSQLRIASIKRQSATMIAQAEGELRDLENGLIEWHRKPSRAKKLFGAELGWLRLDDAELDKDLLARQKQWVADQQKPAAAPIVVPASADDIAAAQTQSARAQTAQTQTAQAPTVQINTADLSDILAGTSSASR